MRLTLYIGGQKADMTEDGFVLLNYAITDLTNPAVLKNSWTQDIDLPATPANDRIFGHSFRADRLAGGGGTGVQFNASQRTSFALYADSGEIIYAGYLKLNSVTKDTYSVSLFGGLGDFIYNLSFTPSGEKMTLADLDYGVDLDFVINKEAVADAWARLEGDTSKPEKWDIINFAPCYNGIPENFSADKAVAEPSVFGLESSITKDGKTYTTNNGVCLINYPDDVDEWAAKDLRSYLQRPVLSVRKLLDAIANENNNGGWSVDLSDLSDVPYLDTWITRPLLPSLGTYKQMTESITGTFVQYSSGNVIGRFALANVPSGAEVTARVRCNLRYSVPGASPRTPLRSWDEKRAQSYVPAGIEQQVLFVQAVGYASDNTQVAAGPVKAYYKSANVADAETLASAFGFIPKGNAGFASADVDHSYSLDNGYYVRQRDLECEITGVNIARIDIEVTAYRAYILLGGGVYSFAGGTGSGTILWYDSANAYNPDAWAATEGSCTATSTSTETLRSGAYITKRMLLSTSGTPAEYLLALCKSFGLYILADSSTKQVTILKRKSFFVNETEDLTDRIDADSVVINPVAFDSKWYEFKTESVGGRFEEEYLNTEGVQYGIQRVDTGYDFDAEVKDLLAGLVLKSCAAVQDRGKYWYSILDNNDFYPSPFIDGGTYTLWNGSENLDTDIVLPAGAGLSPLNTTYPGYDLMSRAEFRDGENKGIDGADVLLFFNYSLNYSHFGLSDDLPVMDAVNGGPCWIAAFNEYGLDIPQFTRYTHRGQDPELLLDFGFPREVDIPGIRYAAGYTIYEQAWQQYIRDRLNVHGKVMTCKAWIDRPGPEALRKFYWYRGSLWMLNKISNYSLTTFDPCECEFVQVRDIANYKNQY